MKTNGLCFEKSLEALSVEDFLVHGLCYKNTSDGKRMYFVHAWLESTDGTFAHDPENKIKGHREVVLKRMNAIADTTKYYTYEAAKARAEKEGFAGPWDLMCAPLMCPFCVFPKTDKIKATVGCMEGEGHGKQV